MAARSFRCLVCAVMALCLLLCACSLPATSVDLPEEPEATAEPETKTSARAAGTHTAARTAAAKSEVPTVLPESKDAGREYLDGTLFIGDSNTARYMMYADDTGKAFTSVDNTIGVVSMSASAITTLKCERFKGYTSAYTIPDAVAMLKPQRILIGFGTNDLAGYSVENYIKQYRKGLDAITAAWEYADIIVCAVPPLDYQRENTRLSMKQVDAFNAALTDLCEEDGYYFLNTAEVLKDPSSGWAKKDYTLSDGVHLSKTAVTALFDYIRTHALTTADRRPKDLGTIPKPDGVPPGLIQKDPIAVRGAKVPVEFVADKGGTLQGYTSQNVKKGGTCSTVTAVPNEGWVFDYWTASIGSAGGGASLTFTVPANADANGVIITAHFAPAEHEHDYIELEEGRVAPTCTEDGSAKYECSICGQVTEKKLPKLGHDWDGGVVIQGATESAEGTILYTCRRDSSHTTTEAIPRLAHQHNFVNGVCACGAVDPNYNFNAGQDSVEPSGGETAQPGGEETDPGGEGGGETEPGGGETEPGGGETEPGGGETEPGGGETEPGGGETEPGGGETEPGDGNGSVEPGGGDTSGGDTDSGTTDPGTTDPNIIPDGGGTGDVGGDPPQ